MKKGLGRGEIRWKANKVHWRTRSSGNPTPRHPQRARRGAACSGARRALGAGAARALCRSRSPRPARRGPARAPRPPLCVSSIRYVQNGPSATAAAPSGRGGGGRGEAVPRSGGGAAAGRAGGSWERAGGGTLGGRSLPSLPLPLPRSPSLPTSGHSGPACVSCSDVGAADPGVFRVVPSPKTGDPKLEKVVLLSPPPSSVSHIPRLLCEMTRQQTLPRFC